MQRNLVQPFAGMPLALPADFCQWIIYLNSLLIVIMGLVQGVLIGFNTSYNVYALVTLSQPVYNFTTNTVTFSYLLGNPAAARVNSAANGFVTTYYTTANDSGVLPLTSIDKQTPLFTPTLFYTIPCATADGPVPAGSCTLSKTGVCANTQHGMWANSTFCA